MSRAKQTRSNATVTANKNGACPKDCASCGYDLSCFSKIAGTLTGEEISRHKIIDTTGLTDTQIAESLQTTSYDLRLGDAHLVYGGVGGTAPCWEKIFIGDQSKFDEYNRSGASFKRPRTANVGTLIIPPYGSALVQLEEIVDTYTLTKDGILVVGRFDLMLSKVNQALISQQATQVEPCYRGKLFCFLHNFSSQNVEINYLDRIATIEFSYVSCFCNRQKRKNLIDELKKENAQKYVGSMCFDKTGIKDVRWFSQNNRMPNDCGLANISVAFAQVKETINTEFDIFIKQQSTIEKVSTAVEKHIRLKLLLLTLILPVIIAIATAIYSNITTPSISELKKQIDGYETIISDLQRQIDGYETVISDLEKRVDALEPGTGIQDSGEIAP